MMRRGVQKIPSLRPAVTSIRVSCTLMLVLYILALVVAIASSSSLNTNATLSISSNRSAYQVNSTIQVRCTVQQQLASQDINASDIVWSQDGVPLPSDDERNLLDATTSLLVVKHAQFGDGGVYGCRLGHDPPEKAVTLKIEVGLPPRKVSNFRCWSTNFRDVECRWKPFDTNLETTHQLMWTDSLQYSYTNCTTSVDYGLCTWTPSKDSPSFHRKLWYQVNSTNALNYCLSDVIKFSRADNTITKPVQMRNVTALSNSSLKVEFLPPVNFNSFSHRSNLEYLITWQYRGTGDNITYSLKTGEDINKPCYTIEGLPRPFGLYHISVKVRLVNNKKAEWSNSSDVISARTSEAAPQPGVKLDFSCGSANTSNNEQTRDVRLTWRAFPEEERNGILLKYVINVNGSEYEVGANATSNLVTDLRKDSYYIFTILARNSVGDSDEDECILPPVRPVIVNRSALVISIVLPFILVIVTVLATFVILRRIKRSMVHIPDIVIPHSLQSDNLHMFSGRHHPLPREQESFDELKTPNGAFHGQKPPSVCPDTHVLDQLESNRKHPLLSARRTNSLVNENYMKGPTEQEALLSPDLALLDLDGEQNSQSGDYPQPNENWKYTALSIQSGGSYAHLREEDDGSYMTMAGGQRGHAERTSDALETRPDWAMQDYAGALEPEAMNHLDGMCGYEGMGGPMIHGAPGRSSSTQELLHPSIGETENCHRPHGSQVDVICGVSYADMGRGPNPLLTDETWITASGGLDPKKQEKPIIKEPSFGRSSPLPPREHLGDAALGDADSSIGSYVKQGRFLSNSPKHPSSRSGSPRVNPRKSRPSAAADGRPSEPEQVKSHSDIKGKLRQDSSGNPCPHDSADGLHSAAAPNSPDISSENDVSPYVLNTCTLSGSTEPLLVGPSKNRVSPEQYGKKHDIENDIGPEKCSLYNKAALPSSYSEDHSTDPSTASSPVVNNGGGYISEHDLPPPPPQAADRPQAEVCGSNGTNDQPALDNYVTVDQLAQLTSSVTPTNCGQDTKVNPKLGGYVDHDEMLKMISPNLEKSTCNGIQDVNQGSHKDDPDSGSITNTALTTKPCPNKATELISEIDE